MTLNELYDRLIKIYGKDKQMNMVIEECSELIKEVSKAIRHDEVQDQDRLAEEIADVLIVTEQLIRMFDLSMTVTEKKYRKIQRLRQRLIEENSKKARADND